jgi:phosphoribosylformimino-5-aminoimidazole carboxamide ribonucleotide (ProFAR) isomerase
LGGDKNKLVIDLSCRRRGDHTWFVAMNKWQTITDMEVNEGKRFAVAYNDFIPSFTMDQFG